MKHWTTKEGKKIPIKDMTTAHIENTIKMLERQQARKIDAVWAAGATFSGDSMASYYAEQEMEECMNTDPHPLYSDLVAELKRRK